MSATPATLNQAPDNVAAAEAVIAALDGCFLAGFARLGAAHRDSLASLGRVLAGTPLAPAMDDAVSALASGPPNEAHLMALAAARGALFGAAHDALFAQAIAATGGAVAPTAFAAADADALEASVKNYMTSVRHWLMEVALAGLQQLEVQTVAPFVTTLEALQAMPPLAGLSALLTGFVDELMDCVPTAALDQVPGRRWVDLWSRAMILAGGPAAAPAATEVSGTLQVLGADVRHHDHLISVDAYGLLALSKGEVSGSRTPLVRVSAAAWKVDAVAGDEVWNPLEDRAGRLLTAIASGEALAISKMTLLSTGDLVWDRSKAKEGEPFDPLATAIEALAPGAGVPAPTVAPLARHPIQLAVPVAVADAAWTTDGERPCLELGGVAVPLAMDRVSPLCGLAFTDLKRSRQVFGLLRYDGGWGFQPLVANGPKKSRLGPGDSIARSRKASIKGGTLGILKERASKLLRA